MATFYASAGGNSGNLGTKASPWSLTYAVAQLAAGDTLYVKKGNYSLSSTLTISVSGTLGNVINIVGYDTNEDDIISVPYSSYNYGDTPATSNFPVLDRGQANLTSAINIAGDYILFKNILVTNAGTAINVDGDNNIIDNCVGSGLGRSGDLAYEGIGFTVAGDSNIIRNCYVEKSVAEGFTCYGSNSVFNDNEAHSVENYETDYLFVFKGSNGTANRNRAIRSYFGSHESRGLCFKTTSGPYIVNDHYIENTKVQINNASGHTIDGLTMIGNVSTNIEIQNDSNNNTIRNFYSEADYSGIIFNDNAETGDGMGSGNRIMNGIIKGGDRMILGRNSSGANVAVGSNTISNVVFDNQAAGIVSDKAFTALNMVNCIVVNQTFSTLSIGIESGSTNVVWSYSIFKNNSFTTPSGTSIIEADPAFTGTGSLADAYKLTASSPAINAGTAVTGRTSDYAGNSFVSTPDIGAFEYQPSGGTPTIYLTERKAFPRAGGLGRYTDGGRGGTVIPVTTLADSGAGSLREALNASGARTIVFRVGGTISLANYIDIDDPNITIAGETAPGDGILIEGGEIRVSSSEVFISNVAIRHGGAVENASNKNCIYLFAQTTSFENTYIDRCSLSWPRPGSGENEGKAFGTGRSSTSYTISNVTMSNCIISESALAILKYAGTYNFSLFNNLMALNSERNIRPNRPVAGEFDFEMVNNIVHGFNWATNPSLGCKFSIIKNRYSESSAFSSSTSYAIKSEAADGGSYETAAGTYVYRKGNAVAATLTELDPIFDEYEENSAFLSSDLEDRALEVAELDTVVLPYIGANVQSRDSVDQRAVDAYTNGNGSLASSGTAPTYSGGTPYADTSGNGMSDAFQSEHSVTDANGIKGVWNFGTFTVDQTGITDWETEGYTNLQMFLFTLRGEWDRMEKTGGTAIPNQKQRIRTILRSRRR